MGVIKDQIVEIRWSGNNRKYYEELGHTYSKQGDTFVVKISEVKNGSSVNVKIVCDHCGKLDIKNLKFIRNRDICCCSKDCASIYKRGKGRPTVPRIKYNCDHCGKENEKTESSFKGRKNNFCNNECASYFMKGKEFLDRRKRVSMKCHFCNNSIEMQAYRLNYAERLFCDMICRSNWQTSEEYKEIRRNANHTIVGKVKLNCSECNGTMEQLPSQIEKSKGNHFCSGKCRNVFMSRNNPNPKKEKVKVNCMNCNEEKEINYAKSLTNKYHFCSKQCYWDWRKYALSGENSPLYSRIKCSCNQCGINMDIIPFEKKEGVNNFCSQKCYWKYRSINYIGESHPNFGNKLSPEHVEKMRIGLVNRYENGQLPRNTSIQKAINSILDELNLSYKNEYNCKYYSIDNYLVDYNLMIEVMGDYWHVNPIKYKIETKINKIQKEGIRRDKSKKTYIKKYNNVEVLYLWENDIRKNILMCTELILHYIENNGMIENYNSFNYRLDEKSNLIINEEIIFPYFEKKI
jgi:G:T-mismatch repair DNA endonuclease (very short patch repair protein)